MDKVVIYNDLVTNRISPRPIFVAAIRPPVPQAHIDRAYAYDPYTRTLFIVGPTGQLYADNGRKLTLEWYRMHLITCSD